MLLAALRVKNRKNHDFHIAFNICKSLFKRGDSLWLIRLHRNSHSGESKDFSHDFNAYADAICTLKHKAEVCRKIRLALGSVENQILAALRWRRRKLDDGGEPSSSHSANTRLVDALKKLLARGILPVNRLKRKLFSQGSSIGSRSGRIENHRFGILPRRSNTLFNSLHKAISTCANRN